MEIFAPSGDVSSFHIIMNVLYCLCLLFFTFYSSSINISFVNDYNDTIYYLLWNSNDDYNTQTIFRVLLTFCCVLTVVLPFWTFY